MPHTHKTDKTDYAQDETAARLDRETKPEYHFHAEPPQKLWWIFRQGDRHPSVAFDLRIPLEEGDLLAEFHLVRVDRVAQTNTEITFEDGVKLNFSGEKRTKGE